MATLTISHYVYLTKEQRYDLHSGKPINAVGVSVPVWFYKGNTSEPAKEIFCEYTLTNEKEHNQIILSNKNGYEINLPQRTDIVVENFKGSEKLLDIEDNGSESLEFNQMNKIKQDEKSLLNIIHFIEIKKIETLMNTLS